MCSSKYPDIYEKKYTTCCGCHVRKCTTHCTVFMMVIQFFSFFPRSEDITNAAYAHITYLRIALTIVALVILGLVVYADKAEKPWAYMPFLFILGIDIIALVVAMVVVITMSISNVTRPSAEGFLIVQLSLFITLLIAIYYWSLVYRARKYMTEEVLSGNTRGDIENCRESI